MIWGKINDNEEWEFHRGLGGREEASSKVQGNGTRRSISGSKRRFGTVGLWRERKNAEQIMKDLLPRMKSWRRIQQ